MLIVFLGDIFRPSYVTEKTANTLIGGTSAIRFVDGIQAVIVTLAGAAIVVFFTTNIIKESQKGDMSIEYWQRVIFEPSYFIGYNLACNKNYACYLPDW